jgi:hypothetical protein
LAARRRRLAARTALAESVHERSRLEWLRLEWLRLFTIAPAWTT